MTRLRFLQRPLNKDKEELEVERSTFYHGSVPKLNPHILSVLARNWITKTVDDGISIVITPDLLSRRHRFPKVIQGRSNGHFLFSVVS